MSATPPHPGQPQPVYIVQQPIYLAPPPRAKALWSMYLGIIAFITPFTVLPALVGLPLGIAALRTEPAGRGPAIVGVVGCSLSILALIGAALVIVWLVQLNASVPASAPTY